MKKFQETAKQFSEVANQLRTDCINYLKEELKKTPDNRYEFDTVEHYLTVSYDGGNHPEYDTNVYSTVEAVYVKDGEIMLDIEDASNYSSDYITVQELCNICSEIEEFDLINSEYEIED